MAASELFTSLSMAMAKRKAGNKLPSNPESTTRCSFLKGTFAR
jgi:hypothetical protein